MEANNIKNDSCIICHGKAINFDFPFGKFQIEKCADCGMKRMHPQPTDSELGEIYNANYFLGVNDTRDHSHASMLKSNTADQYLNLLESYVQAPLTGRLLEIGCGHGDFLARAAARGLTVTGVEYSAHAVEIASKKAGNSVRVICGEIAQLAGSGEKFDYIVFADVLEHVRDPRAFLRHVRSLLSDNGVAVAIVPSLDSFSAKLMRNKWVEFKLEHLWYFSKKTLREIFTSEGFGDIKVSPAKKTLSFDYIAQHFDHYPVQPFSAMINIVRRLTPQSLRKRPFGIVASGIVQFARKKNEAHSLDA